MSVVTTSLFRIWVLSYSADLIFHAFIFLFCTSVVFFHFVPLVYGKDVLSYCFLFPRLEFGRSSTIVFLKSFMSGSYIPVCKKLRLPLTIALLKDAQAREISLFTSLTAGNLHKLCKSYSWSHLYFWKLSVDCFQSILVSIRSNVRRRDGQHID